VAEVDLSISLSVPASVGFRAAALPSVINHCGLSQPASLHVVFFDSIGISASLDRVMYAPLMSFFGPVIFYLIHFICLLCSALLCYLGLLPADANLGPIIGSWEDGRGGKEGGRGRDSERLRESVFGLISFCFVCVLCHVQCNMTSRLGCCSL
jgi:hypothetical protein